MNKKFGMYCWILAVSFATILLQGCGFHLRVNSIASPSLKVLNVVSTDRNMEKDVKEALKRSGVTLDANALYQVHVGAFTQDQDNQTLSTAGLSSRALSASVEWVLKDARGAELFMPRTVSSGTTIQSSEGSINADDAAMRSSRNMLMQQIAAAIVRQIGAISDSQLVEMKKLANKSGSVKRIKKTSDHSHAH